jgi:prepilin-type N-terminal cleavage/methylation domain-containing protein
MMRRAFTLIEMLVVVTILPIVMIAVSGVYATFIRDIPRSARILQENTTVLHLLGQIRRDMDEAVGLPQQRGEWHADERTLLVEQPGRVIRYQIDNGRVVRTVLGEMVSQVAASHPQSQERVWRTQNAVIVWRPWMQDGRAYAVEVRSHVRQWVSGLLREKLANSHVFFLRGLGALPVVQPPSAGESVESPPRAGVLQGPVARAREGGIP